jgi:hypothetical protein
MTATIQLTADEHRSIGAVVDVLWEEAQDLPTTSRVRAWLLRIRSPLAEFQGTGSFGDIVDVDQPVPDVKQDCSAMSGGEWDARAEFDLGVLISSYLRRNPPPPPGSRLAGHLERVGAALQDHGRDRLDRLGRPRLRAVPGGNL